MGEDCIDNKGDNPSSNTEFPFPTTNTYNLTDLGHGTTYWDGDVCVSKSYYGDPDVTMRKKVNTILEKIQIIERTLLAVLDELRQIKSKTKE